MGERARLLALLAGGAPDRVPWYGDLSYWIPAALESGALGREYAGDGVYALHRDLGVGFYLQGYFPFRAVSGDGVEIESRTEGNARHTVTRTPISSLNQTEVYLPGSYTSAIVEHPVKDLRDLETYADLVERTRFEPDYAEAIRRGALIGDLGVCLCYLPKSPFMELIALKSGVANVTEMRCEDEARFASILARIERRMDAAAEISLAAPAECLMLPENISSEVVGKGPFLRYMDGWHRRWNGRIRGAGKVSFVHLDGTLRGLISEISAAGARVIEALTPKPVGDLDVSEWIGRVGDHSILWGGIPGALFSDHVSDAAFDEHVKRVLDAMARVPRFVLGVADQVPPGARIERIARVREFVDRYGAY